MEKSLKFSQFSFGQPSNFIENENPNLKLGMNNLGNSFIQNNDNNFSKTNEFQFIEFEKILKEYEENQNKNKNEIQTHFSFAGDLIRDSLNNSDNININNENKNINNNINASKSEEDFLNNFLSDEEIQKKCRVYSNSNYIVFENLYKENSCYINVILHFLYISKDIKEYLINLYLLKEKNKIVINEQNIDTDKEKDNKQKIKFLALLGKILYQYNKGLENKDHQIIRLRTLEFRKFLNDISNGKFLLNYVADPLDFLNYVLEILNEKIKEDLKTNFFVELCEQYDCKKCKIVKKNYYDKDNFILQLYVHEILNYLNSLKLTEKNFKNKLFLYSQFISLKSEKNCEKCQKKMVKKIKCKSNPNYLIINCIWSNPLPRIEEVIKFFVLINLKEDLKNLFQCSKLKQNIKLNYYLSYIILYSSSLGHYITAKFNPKEKMFCLYDDSCIIEFKTFIEFIEAITINLLKNGEKLYYYPVLLIYDKKDIFDDDTFKLNQLNEESYKYLINNCNLSIKEYRDKKAQKEEIQRHHNSNPHSQENKNTNNINFDNKINNDNIKINDNTNNNNNITNNVINNNIDNDNQFNSRSNNFNNIDSTNINNNDNSKNIQMSNNNDKDDNNKIIFKERIENIGVNNQILISNDLIAKENNHTNQLIDSILIDNDKNKKEENTNINKKNIKNEELISPDNLIDNENNISNEINNENEKNTKEQNGENNDSFSFNNSFNNLKKKNNNSQGNTFNLLDLNIYFDYNNNNNRNKNPVCYSKKEEIKNNSFFDDINLQAFKTKSEIIEAKTQENKNGKNIMDKGNDNNKLNQENNSAFSQSQKDNIQNIIDDLV